VIVLCRIFALDVGTRNVVLLSAEKTKENKIMIDHVISMEHETRAMEDGQIHDIAKVSEVVDKLRNEMEKVTSAPVDEVAVAVAGRNLVTSTGKGEKEFNIHNELSEDDIRSVELLAIQDAMSSLREDTGEYHCVGYTVSGYLLDGISLKNPLFQKGSKLEVEVLATFLPKIVVDSMYTMVKKSDLLIKTLTLEPIAAINVVIPEDMRKLNIALVDIGAGTSDIAITKNGRIIGYGMVPMAGDEITETIEQEYLLDFKEAERIKKDLYDKGDFVVYEDVLGLEMEIPKSEILDKVDGILNELSTKIADKITEVNESVPQAIILIGGGSLIPGLKEKIAEKVSLVAGRVAIRGTEAIKNLVDNTETLKTSLFVTPIGIANMAFEKKGFNILELVINNESHRVFSFNKEISLMEALISSGVGSKDLYSKPGKPITYTVNGKLYIEKGELGKKSVIKINGHSKTLDDTVSTGDVIEIIKMRDGRDATLFGKDILKRHGRIEIIIDGEKKEFFSNIKKFGEEINETYKVEDRDEFQIEEFLIENIFDKELTRTLEFILDRQKQKLVIPTKEIYKDEILVGSKELLEHGAEYITRQVDESVLKVKDIIDIKQETFSVQVNDKEIVFDEIKNCIYINGEEAEENRIIKNNDVIESQIPEHHLPIVSDIFKYYNPVEMLSDKQGVLIIEVNGEKAEFVTKLRNNDRIRLFYIESKLSI
jgi:cell division protein FtsA